MTDYHGTYDDIEHDIAHDLGEHRERVEMEADREANPPAPSQLPGYLMRRQLDREAWMRRLGYGKGKA